MTPNENEDRIVETPVGHFRMSTIVAALKHYELPKANPVGTSTARVSATQANHSNTPKEST